MDWMHYDSRAFAWLGERAFNLFSQEGADGILEAIFEKIGETNRFCCEFGAADGLWFSNTRRLIEKGWGGLLIEAEKKSYDALESRYRNHPKVSTCHALVEPQGANTIDNLLEWFSAPKDPDLFVVDVDGQDYYILNGLARHHPRVIVCEYDRNADPMAIPELGGPGMAGEMAIIHVGNARGYLPVCKSPYNLYFVRNDLINLVAAPVDDVAVREFYAKWERETNKFLSDCRGVVHIGANTGQERDLYASRNLPVIWVEALPDVFGWLLDNIAGYENQLAFNYLLTDEDGKEYDFGVANNEGQSSSIFDFADHKKIWPQVEYESHINLISTRFDTMIEDERIDLGGYDALVMDVQGAELLVLKGMGNLVDNFRYIRSETADFEIYKGGCQLKDLDEYLIPRGFKRVRSWRAAGRPDVGYAYEVLYARSDVVETQNFASGTDGQNLCLINRLDGLEAPKDDLIRLCAVMTTGRLGFLSTMDCVFSVLTQVPHQGFIRTEGVFWNQNLTRSIEDAIAKGANYILTIDFDSLFTPDDVKRLVCHLHDNPDVDVIVPLQMRRENGGLLIASDGEVDLRESLIPIIQGHFGLTMIRANVFDKLSKPWFQEVPDASGGWGEGRTDSDISFWRNCRENGVKTVAAPDVVIGHLELVASWPNQAFQSVYQTLNDWRSVGKPPEAFIKPPIDASDPKAVGAAGERA